jgi:hypothetical protein
MESVSKGERSYILISIEGGLSIPIPDVTQGIKPNSVTVLNLEYFTQSILGTPDIPETNKY